VSRARSCLPERREGPVPLPAAQRGGFAGRTACCDPPGVRESQTVPPLRAASFVFNEAAFLAPEPSAVEFQDAPCFRDLPDEDERAVSVVGPSVECLPPRDPMDLERNDEGSQNRASVNQQGAG